MKLLSVNIGAEDEVQRKGYRERTGIFKQPAANAVKIGKLGLKDAGSMGIQGVYPYMVLR